MVPEHEQTSGFRKSTLPMVETNAQDRMKLQKFVTPMNAQGLFNNRKDIFTRVY